MPLALVDNKIKDAILIDADQLKQLSTYICNVLNFHDLNEITFDEQSMRAFEREYDMQGYCNKCRDFAARIVVRFDLTDRDNANRRFELAAKLRADLSRENNGFLSIEEVSRA